MTKEEVDARIREFLASDEFKNAVRDGYGKDLEAAELTPMKADIKKLQDAPVGDPPKHRHIVSGATDTA